MARTRSIYQSDLLYVGPTGENSCTGAHFGNPATHPYNTTTPQLQSGNLIAELFRVQKADYGWTKSLTDVNQLGELAAIDRIPLEQPTVNMSFSYLLSNLVNEKLLGFTVAKAGSTADVTCISGILAGVTDSKNYFIKTVAEGQDVNDNSAVVYNTIGIGNGFISSYSSQGSVGSFPTVDVSIEGLNMEGDAFSATTTGNIIPAVNPTNGAAIAGFWYNLPTGLTSLNDAALTADAGISALRPGDITLNLGSVLGAGDTMYTPSDLKVQSYNFSFNLSRENLQQLGSKYAYAKTISFPVTASLSVTAIVGDMQTGSLIDIVNDNDSFDPAVTITKPGSASTVIAQIKLKNAKLDNQSTSSSIGSNKQVTLNFTTQLSGPSDLTKGVFFSGITV